VPNLKHLIAELMGINAQLECVRFPGEIYGDLVDQVPTTNFVSKPICRCVVDLNNGLKLLE